jgi:para-aminobenzoate synthetase/4-amino-4-deoxychorismate lyase
MGWWSPDGSAEFNVAIRCATVDTARGEAEYPVGSGITWDSNAEGEYEECLSKAAVLSHRPERFELLESILFEGEFFLLDRHLDRLAASARYFGFSIDIGAIRERILSEAQTRAGGAFKVRLWVAREGSVRSRWEPAASNTPLRVGFAAAPVSSTDVYLFHKTTRRQVYENALRARPDCDDVLLFNERGELTESTIANVVINLDGIRYTPPVDCGLLAGTFRAVLLERGEVHERVLTREDVLRSREIHLINSVRKWIPAVLADATWT